MVDEPVDDEPEVESREGEPEINPLAQPVLGSSVGAIGLVGYGDDAEYSGEPVVTVFTPPYVPFLATDARSVMITLLPHHYNLIPNPAFRVNGAGWVATGIEPAPTSFSWRVANTAAQAGLIAITTKTANAAVDPDPLASPAYIDGQIVKIVNTLAANVTVAWLKIDNSATLTVAAAAAVGVTLSQAIPRYRVYDPAVDSLSADSWVGQSLVTNGTGMLRYREQPDRFVFVGPLSGTKQTQWDPRRGGPEYTLSVYVKGAGDVRLTMDAYEVDDRTVPSSAPPEYQNLVQTATPATYAVGQAAIQDSTTGRVWTAIEPVPTVAPFYADIGRGPIAATVSGEWTPTDDDGEWHRVSLRTRARVPENEGAVEFTTAWWIDTKIEVRSAKDLKISAVMLDPTEYPEAAYFDGEMTESLFLDDFLWEASENASPSYYYFDRVVRAKWLHERMGYVAPAGRPHQIFFGSYWRPYVGKTGETIVLNTPPSKTILDDAIWRVDSKTALSDRLTDLSGNGRDAIFGAAAAAPLVLPHTGTDYVYLNSGGSTNLLTSTITQPLAGTVVVTIDLTNPAALGGLFDIGGGAANGWAVSVAGTGTTTLTSKAGDAAAAQESLTSASVVQMSHRFQRFTKTGLVVSYAWSDNGTTWTSLGTVVTHTGTRTQTAGIVHLGVASTLANGTGGRFYSARVNAGGVDTFVMDPRNAFVNYTTIANTGTLGGNWTISRATSGVKTVVVDRPLLLFSGAQIATVGGDGLVNIATKDYTIVYSGRHHWAGAGGVDYGAVSSNQSTTAGTAIYRGAATYNMNGQITTGTSLGATCGVNVSADGVETLALRALGQTLSMFLNGVHGQSMPITGTRSGPSSIPMKIGSLDGWGFGEIEFGAMAVWDRALTDAEIADASYRLANG